MDKRVVGSLLIIAGLIAALYGYVDLGSFRSQVLNVVGVTNTFAHQLIFGGAIVAGIGIVLLLFKSRRRSGHVVNDKRKEGWD